MRRSLWTALATAAVAAVVLATGLGCAPKAQPAAGGVPVEEIAALAPTAPAPGRDEYRIQAEDELHVRFTYQPELNEQVPVRRDGRISLATTGEIRVEGMTPTELERMIEKQSSRRLRDPEVVVVVTKIAEQRVYVGGEVMKPGYVSLRQDMTPLQAVVQAGGFKNTAKLESVVLLTPGVDGRFSAARMDMDQVVTDGVPERVRLHPGDVVYVPKTWIAEMNVVVDQYVRGLIPALPRVGVGYSLNQ